MIRKYVLSALALAGVGLGIFAAIRSARKMIPTPMVADPPSPPYQTFVAGAGLVEANTENIAIGTQIAGIVSKIDVQIGSQVRKGDPLFTIDDRAQRALIAVDTAAVSVAEAQLKQARYELGIGKELSQKKVNSAEDLETRQNNALTAEAQFIQAKANLEAAQTNLDRLTVRAPVDGQILQLKIHVGEFAPTGVLAQPLILFGNVEPMNLRVNVDENDAWRVQRNATAVAYLRGNREIKVLLKFVRYEPYVIPKVSLTGSGTERVDTRVLQAIYSFERGDLPIFVGQQMDVFIDAGALAPPGSTTQR